MACSRPSYFFKEIILGNAATQVCQEAFRLANLFVFSG